MIDSHCHLNLLDLTLFDNDMDALLNRAKQEGLQHVLCVGIDLINAQQVLDIAEKYDMVSASVGVHPSEKCSQEPTLEDLKKLAMNSKVVAIGETGLDYYYNDSGLDIMRDRFRMHIRLAKKLGKPLIVHTRDAKEDTINIMREEGADEFGGVMHCFTEDWEMAEKALALNFYISFSGIVTFKNAENVQQVAQKVPLNKILIETDAPYLTPIPFRGKPNYPHYVKYVAQKIAQLHQMTTEEVIAATTQNYFDLFGKKKN